LPARSIAKLELMEVKEFPQLACILHEGWGDLFFSVGCKRAILQSTNIFPTRKHYA